VFREENAIRDYYERMMRKYFRKNPPIPTNIYLSGEVLENEKMRAQVARTCHFPSIINILANDESDLVRTTARKSEFWREIGCYQDILGFGKHERRSFARTEGQANILVLLIFEDDVDVINEVLRNPTVTLNTLVLFQHLLKERGVGRKDEQLYMMARHILNERRDQIIKISQINKAAERIADPININSILDYFTQKDITVRRAIENILSIQPAAVVRDFIYQAMEEQRFKSLLDHFIVLSGLIEILQKREDLKLIPISALKIKEHHKTTKPFRSVADFFINLLIHKRQQVVKQSGQDLTNLHNVTLLAHCHASKEINLRATAAEIMPLKDILILVNEITTPRKVFKEILSILENHPDEAVIEQVRETYMRESQRMRDSLKELEISVQAYFDIIFHSLGYNKINEFLNVVRSIKTTEKQLRGFKELVSAELGEGKQDLEKLLDKVKRILQDRANVIYFDTGAKITHELESIFELIENVFRLREMGIDSIRPGTPQDIESEIRARARIIWQSAISAYLGRIKDLSEMIRKKILQAAGTDIDKSDLERDIWQAGEDLEKSYKEKIECGLVNSCRVCGKRGCSAERFLQETHFFIKEYLDNFVVNE